MTSTQVQLALTVPNPRRVSGKTLHHFHLKILLWQFVLTVPMLKMFIKELASAKEGNAEFKNEIWQVNRMQTRQFKKVAM